MNRIVHTAGLLLAVFALTCSSLDAAAEKVLSVVPLAAVGEINGKSATFSSLGQFVVLSTREASRLGIAYEQSTKEMAGDIPYWSVTLDSVRTGNSSPHKAIAWVVRDVQAFSAYLEQAVPPPLELPPARAKVNGRDAVIYSAGMGGFLMATTEADRIGLDYRKVGKALPAEDGVPARWGLMVRMAFPGYPESEAAVSVVADVKQFAAAIDRKVNQSMADRRRRLADHERKRGRP